MAIKHIKLAFKNPWGKGGRFFSDIADQGVGRWFEDKLPDQDEASNMQQVSGTSCTVVFGQYVANDPTGIGPVTLTTNQTTLLTRLGNIIAANPGNVLIMKVKGTSSSAYSPSGTATANSLIRAIGEAGARATAVGALLGFAGVDPDATGVVAVYTAGLSPGGTMRLETAESELGPYIGRKEIDAVRVILNVDSNNTPRNVRRQISQLLVDISNESPYGG